MTNTKDEAKAVTPHSDLIAELLNPNIPKTEREHAASWEIERLLALAAPTVQEPVGEAKHMNGVSAAHTQAIFLKSEVPVGTKLYTTPPAAAPVQPEQEPVTILPDGSAFSVVSLPLPEDHWLYVPHHYMPGAFDPVELPSPVTTHADRERVTIAIRYAIRCATMCGKDMGFDPDALVQNAVYALCGPFGTAEQDTPPAQPAPVQPASCLVRRLEAVADVPRLEGDHNEADVIDEAVAVLKTNTPPAKPAVPDAIDHTDLSENMEYIRGWNECRELTIQMQITSPTKQGGAA
jgi:hypothetical protein